MRLREFDISDVELATRHEKSQPVEEPVSDMQPEIKIEPARYMPRCNCCGRADDAKSLVLGHRYEAGNGLPGGGNAHCTTMCGDCRRKLVLALIDADFPGMPCGWDEAEPVPAVLGMRGAMVRSDSLGLVWTEEALGVAGDWIRTAYGAEELPMVGREEG